MENYIAALNEYNGMATTFWQRAKQNYLFLSFIYFVSCSHKTALVSILKQSSNSQTILQFRIQFSCRTF